MLKNILDVDLNTLAKELGFANRDDWDVPLKDDIVLVKYPQRLWREKTRDGTVQID